MFCLIIFVLGFICCFAYVALYVGVESVVWFATLVKEWVDRYQLVNLFVWDKLI